MKFFQPKQRKKNDTFLFAVCSTASVCDIILSNKLDIFSVTKTWLASNGNNTSLAENLNSLTDFKVLQAPRENAKGGGVALLFRKVFNTVKNASPKFTSFEHLDVTICYAKFKARLVIIYRPPPSRKNKLTVSRCAHYDR